jgi:hypothetical protein
MVTLSTRSRWIDTILVNATLYSPLWHIIWDLMMAQCKGRNMLFASNKTPLPYLVVFDSITCAILLYLTQRGCRNLRHGMHFLSHKDITQIVWIITHKQKELKLDSISDRIYYICHEMEVESVFCLALKHYVSSRCIALNLWPLFNRFFRISLNYLQLWM